MSLLLLLGGEGCPEEGPDSSGSAGPGPDLGQLEAALDAIFKSDDRIGGRAFTRLTEDLSADDATCMRVESTIGFGEQTDGAATARVLVGGELVDCGGRNAAEPYLFHTLTRGLDNTEATFHPAGTIVLDMAQNTTGVDHVRRGLFVETAVGEDLRVIARNLGLKRCPGMTEDQLRRVIQAVAYLPKQTRQAFVEAMQALTDGVEGTDFDVVERLYSSPWTVFVEIFVGLSTDLRGRMLLNGEAQLTDGVTQVTVDYPVIQSTLAPNPSAPSKIIEGRTVAYPGGAIGTLQWGVYDDTPLTRRGFRDGFTNYATGGSAAGNVITLGSSPGGIGTPVLVDYTAFVAHYVALDETVRQDLLNEDHWAYLADPLLTARCLLDQIRAAGVRVELVAKT